MKFNKLKIIKFTLFILIILVAFVSINSFYQFHDNGQFAIIEQNGVKIHRIDLCAVKQPYFIDVSAEYPSKILVEPGQISFYKSSCPDKICEHYGKLSKKGQVAICLPAKIIIKIENNNKSTDSITG